VNIQSSFWVLFWITPGVKPLEISSAFLKLLIWLFAVISALVFFDEQQTPNKTKRVI
jgi:hypothetical protein